MGVEAILAGIASGVSIYSGVKAMTAKGPAAPEKIAAAPTTLDNVAGADSLNAVKKDRQKMAAAQGYQSTIATSGLGDPSQANVGKKTLLGA